MAKPRIIIADTDISYIIPLQLKFVEDFFEKVDLEIITESEYFESLFSTPQKADILIVSDELYSQAIQRHNISHIFVMDEQYEEDQTADLNINHIFKYTSIKEIFNEITGKSADVLKLESNGKQETQVILFYSASGGTGKTTTAYNLGAALSEQGKKVLLIDNDSQASLTKALGFSPADCSLTLTTLMCQAIDSPELLKNSLKKTTLHHQELDLLPANQKLSGIATRLIVIQTTAGMFSGPDTINPAYVLRSIIDLLQDQYDFILIDCSPHPDMQMVNALAASNTVIIPVQAHYLDSEGLPDTLEFVRRVRQSYQPKLSVLGILVTMYKDRTRLSRAVHHQIENQYGSSLHVFMYPIDYSIRAAEHPAHGKSIFEFAPRSTVAKSYMSMAKEVLHEAQWIR